MAPELRIVSGKSDRGVSVLGQVEVICQRGVRDDAPGAGATPGRGPGPTRGWGPHLLLGWPLRKLSWLRGLFPSKTFCLFFLEFSVKVLFLHNNKTPIANLLKTASVYVSSNQIVQIRDKTIAKVFGKVDMFETYHLPQV